MKAALKPPSFYFTKLFYSGEPAFFYYKYPVGNFHKCLVIIGIGVEAFYSFIPI
jgi:hypothetical protein